MLVLFKKFHLRVRGRENRSALRLGMDIEESDRAPDEVDFREKRLHAFVEPDAVRALRVEGDIGFRGIRLMRKGKPLGPGFKCLPHLLTVPDHRDDGGRRYDGP